MSSAEDISHAPWPSAGFDHQFDHQLSQAERPSFFDTLLIRAASSGASDAPNAFSPPFDFQDPVPPPKKSGHRQNPISKTGDQKPGGHAAYRGDTRNGKAGRQYPGVSQIRPENSRHGARAACRSGQIDGQTPSREPRDVPIAKAERQHSPERRRVIETHPGIAIQGGRRCGAAMYFNPSSLSWVALE